MVSVRRHRHRAAARPSRGRLLGTTRLGPGRRSRLLGLPLAAVMVTLAATPTAGAAQRFEVFPTPSAQGHIDPAINRLNGATDLRTTVLLPDGYDADPGRRWPVVYLLHGVDDNSSTWRSPRSGDVARAAAGLPAVIVMPEGGRSYYTDHWLGGSRRGAAWERYLLDDVIPAVESRYRISAERADRAIAGPSMGGLGAMLFAAQLPGYFGTTIAMSALLDLENPAAQFILPPASRISYGRIWGRYGGQYAKAHSPNVLLPNLTQTRVRLSTGNGLVDRRYPADLRAIVLGGSAEAASWFSTRDTHRRARAQGVPATLSTHVGIHDWPYWSADLTRSIRWGLFAPLPAGAPDPSNFRYRTIAARGNAWGLGYRFATPPTRLMDLSRSGQTITATGAGTITITPGAAAADASGAGTATQCAFTARLPFTRTLPPGC